MSGGRTWVLAATLALISVPAVVALTAAVSFDVSNRSNGTLVVAGKEREYTLYVPTTYDPRRPTPLVIGMHGAGLWGAAQQATSRWNRIAEREGFVAVYPSGASGAGPRIWRVDDDPRLMQDVRFIATLIDTLTAQYNIDATRIYANGLSNGGGMAFVLSCTMADRIAAVGMVAAALTLPWHWCADHRPVPAIWFHGTADPAVPYLGGTTWIAPRRPFPNVPGFVANWSRRNRCADTPVDSAVAADVTRREYTHCADDASVVLYTVQGGGHTWPGGKPLPAAWLGPTNKEIDATSLMWAFFRAHPLRRQ